MKKLLLFLLLIVYSQATLACDCIISPVKQQIKSTPYLLTGKVIEILDGNAKGGRDYHVFLRSMGIQDTISRGYSIRFLIQEDFKGKYKAGSIIEIHSTYSNCDILFDIDKNYVLFLHKEQDYLFPTYCSYSDILDGSPASNDLMKAIHGELKTRHKR
ncbi:hypothetical protein [Hymenobacter sp. IS2118]|uniref:hypothetical protein n=1 Tax=Hymenobacter sp. IS2118 TaxID=1505605 RepID=UPI000551876C|nr:hypothetical protein [Hymenobacter sp. IS2118]